MNKRSTHLLILPCLALLLGASACGLALFVDVPCFDNLDCPYNQECDLEKNRCEDIHLPPPAFLIDLELVPQAGPEVAITQIASVDLRKVDPSHLPLQLARPVTVSGQIMTPGAVQPSLVGNVVFTRAPGFDARSLSWNVMSDESGRFSAQVSPGTYQVLFKPQTRETLPQLLQSEFVVPEDVGLLSPSLVYDAFPEDAIAGEIPVMVIRGKILQSENYPHAVTGLLVDAVSPEGLRSSLATPDLDGNFTLRLPVSRVEELTVGWNNHYPQIIDLNIWPAGSDILLPSVTVPQLAITSEDLGTLYLGEVPAPHLISGFVVTADPKNPAPVAGCQLRFEAAQVGNGGFVHTTQTDDQGRFSATIPGTAYTVLAVPEPLSYVGIQSWTLDLSSDLKDVVYPIEKRRHLTGVVVDHEGAPVGDAMVRARRLSAVNGDNDGVVRSYETQSLPDGSFDLGLDDGRYNVVFVPSAESGLPRTVPQRIYVAGNDVVMDLEQTRVPEAALLQGFVTDRAGVPQCGVSIGVFQSTADSASLIGESVSGGEQDTCQGAFAVIVPLPADE